MLPYFKYTDEIQGFCRLMGIHEDEDIGKTEYVCMYSRDYKKFPHIAPYNLSPGTNPQIHNERVLSYLVFLLNGYTYKDAIKASGAVVGNGHSSIT